MRATSQQLCKFAYDAGATDPAVWSQHIKLTDDSDGQGPRLVSWTVPGITQPTLAQLPTVADAATWWDGGRRAKRLRVLQSTKVDQTGPTAVTRAALRLIFSTLTRMQQDLNAIADVTPAASVPQRPIRTWDQLMTQLEANILSGDGEP